MGDFGGDEVSPIPISKIDHVQFGILSPEEVKAMSVVKVTTHNTFVDGGKADSE